MAIAASIANATNAKKPAKKQRNKFDSSDDNESSDDDEESFIAPPAKPTTAPPKKPSITQPPSGGLPSLGNLDAKPVKKPSITGNAGLPSLDGLEKKSKPSITGTR